jgi:hypothetical protein
VTATPEAVLPAGLPTDLTTIRLGAPEPGVLVLGGGLEIEARTSKELMAGFDPAEVERPRPGVLERGQAQTGPHGSSA